MFGSGVGTKGAGGPGILQTFGNVAAAIPLLPLVTGVFGSLTPTLIKKLRAANRRLRQLPRRDGRFRNHSRRDNEVPSPNRADRQPPPTSRTTDLMRRRRLPSTRPAIRKRSGRRAPRDGAGG